MFLQCAEPHKLREVKVRLIYTPAFGNNAFPFCQDTVSYLLAVQLALSAIVKGAVGSMPKWLLVQSCVMSTIYQLAFLAILSLADSRMTQEKFTRLHKQEHPVPSMGFRLAKVDTRHKHMMFVSADVLFTYYD
jgi:hypothetical protein